MEQDDQTKADFVKFWEHISWSSQNETMIILKGHLLVEEILREYCASKVEKADELEKAKLTFAQISQLTRALQKYPTAQWVWLAVSKLNLLRNKLAHKLVPEDYEKNRNEFIHLVRSQNGEDLFNSFPKTFEQVAVSIFMIYTTLSINLRFRPQSLLAAAILKRTRSRTDRPVP